MPKEKLPAFAKFFKLIHFSFNYNLFHLTPFFSVSPVFGSIFQKSFTFLFVFVSFLLFLNWFNFCRSFDTFPVPFDLFFF